LLWLGDSASLPQVLWFVLPLAAVGGLLVGALSGGVAAYLLSAEPGGRRFAVSAGAAGLGVLGSAGISLLVWRW
jgi:hypothetical protein